jgi:hypothetical protein
MSMEENCDLEKRCALCKGYCMFPTCFARTIHEVSAKSKQINPHYRPTTSLASGNPAARACVLSPVEQPTSRIAETPKPLE